MKRNISRELTVIASLYAKLFIGEYNAKKYNEDKEAQLILSRVHIYLLHRAMHGDTITNEEYKQAGRSTKKYQ